MTRPSTTPALSDDDVQRFLDEIVHVDRPRAGHPRLADLADDIARTNLAPGTPVLIAMPNGAELIAVVFAVRTAGLVPVPITPSAPPARIRQMAEALGAGALVAPRTFEPAGYEIGRTVPPTAQLALLRDIEAHRHHPGEIILLTSGTSGVFSGCLHDFDSLLRNGSRHAAAIGQRSTDSVLINLPLHFSYAFVAQMLATLTSGGRAVISGPPFAPRAYAEAIRRYGVNISSVTPAVVTSISKAGSKLPRNLRALTVGGAALDPSYVRELLRHNARVELYLTYGLTEAGPRVSTLAAHREPPSRYSSVGLPLPGVGVRLNKPDPDEPVGELIVDTDTAMLGRVGISDARRTTVDDNGIHTGDLFSMDPDGYLYCHGRLPKYVVIRGEKVCLSSVAGIAERQPGITAARAWAHQDDSGETEFTLDVYLDETATVREQDIHRRLGEQLLRAERPARIRLHPAASLGWAKSVPE
ncbi:class I adenylate-forming enzyme family protein [Nocardia sp. BMG51109]|uniref:class I adenylate-forming enzyme family protein n=1 Tax=Nocardia sp. BMG51109 TaxID=1056816 RepID=UPI0004676302|nr:class I adenylate-forming enzyme family protein [Nocardia sp. BMG51109]